MKFNSSTTRLYVQVGVASTQGFNTCVTHRRTDSALRGTAINNLSNRVTRLRYYLVVLTKVFRGSVTNLGNSVARRLVLRSPWACIEVLEPLRNAVTNLIINLVIPITMVTRLVAKLVA